MGSGRWSGTRRFYSFDAWVRSIGAYVGFITQNALRSRHTSTRRRTINYISLNRTPSHHASSPFLSSADLSALPGSPLRSLRPTPTHMRWAFSSCTHSHTHTLSLTHTHALTHTHQSIPHAHQAINECGYALCRRHSPTPTIILLIYLRNPYIIFRIL